MNIERTAGVSKTVLVLLLCSVSCASLSAILHSRLHSLSHLFFFLCSGFSFLALLKLANTVAHSLPRPIEVFIHWIHAMSFELLALVGIIVCRFSRFSKTFHKPVGAGTLKPVLLVHGYCHDGSAWSYLKHQLAKENIGPIYTIDLGFPFSPIREYAMKVKEKADQIRQETGISNLALVGHSMGGLVSSLYATDLSPPNTVTDVITLGTPFKGTHMAKMGIGPNAREMEPSSELATQLRTKIANEKFSRFYHIASNTDQMVIPPQSGLLKNDLSREFFFEDIGHASMLFSPRVGALISGWLNKPN